MSKFKNNPKQAETVSVPSAAIPLRSEPAAQTLPERTESFEAVLTALRLQVDKQGQALAALELKWAKHFGA